MDIDDQIAATLESAPPPEARRRRVPRFSPVTLIIAILLAAVLAESVLLFRGNTEERTRTQVLQTAQRFLVLLTTYNSTTLEQQRARVLGLATGQFKSQYEQLTGTEFLAALRERQADSKGTIVRLAVTDVNGDDASVLGLVEVSITNKDLRTPKDERNVIDLSLVHTRSGWRIDAVVILGTI